MSNLKTNETHISSSLFEGVALESAYRAEIQEAGFVAAWNYVHWHGWRLQGERIQAPTAEDFRSAHQALAQATAELSEHYEEPETVESLVSRLNSIIYDYALREVYDYLNFTDQTAGEREAPDQHGFDHDCSDCREAPRQVLASVARLRLDDLKPGE